MEGKRVYKKRECVYCKQVKFIAAKGLCRACYYRLNRGGTLEHHPKRQRSVCEIEGCGERVVTHGVCERHRVRSRKVLTPRVLSDDPQAIASREWRRKAFLKAKSQDLKKQFGITLEEYTALLEKQNGVCAICGQKDKRIHRATGLPMNLAVDHCHTTKKVRGLLCGPCNHGLGNFNEDVQLMKKAADYLEAQS